MHFVFIPYGKRNLVEEMFKYMETEKHILRIYKPKQKDKNVFINPQLRIMPFGIYEYIFPKENLDLVLTTMLADLPANNDRYIIGNLKLEILRRILKLKKIPKKYKTDKHYLWPKEFVTIIPLGIREDNEFIYKEGINKDWMHEAI